MKYLLSYGIWLGAIWSYLLIFFEPNHVYIPYAENIITVYEALCWVMFSILSVFTTIVMVGHSCTGGLEVEGKPAAFEKALGKIILFNKGFIRLFLKYVHYLFILGIGVFVGDVSMTLVLTLNSILQVILMHFLKKILEEASNGNT